MQRLCDVKNLVVQLYEALHVGEHQLKKERELMGQLESLKAQLVPIERVIIIIIFIFVLVFLFIYFPRNSFHFWFHPHVCIFLFIYLFFDFLI